MYYNPVAYFVSTFFKNVIFWSLAIGAFVVGNNGFTGSALVTAVAFLISATWYCLYCVLLGPQLETSRSYALQGYLIVVHGSGAFASILIYVWRWHEGLDDCLPWEEVRQYWEAFFPYIFASIPVVSFIMAMGLTCLVQVIEQEQASRE